MITITNQNTNTSITVVPSKMTWSLMDVSAAESGRTYTGRMYKNRVTQKRKLQLEFAGTSWSETSAILQKVNSEYVTVTYPDMLTGSMRTSEFYVGDREAPVFVWWDGKKICSSVTFDLLER